MNVVQKIFEVSQKISTVQEFYDFSEEIHKMFECDQTDCDIKNYFEALREIILIHMRIMIFQGTFYLTSP